MLNHIHRTCVGSIWRKQLNRIEDEQCRVFSNQYKLELARMYIDGKEKSLKFWKKEKDGQYLLRKTVESIEAKRCKN